MHFPSLNRVLNARVKGRLSPNSGRLIERRYLSLTFQIGRVSLIAMTRKGRRDLRQRIEAFGGFKRLAKTLGCSREYLYLVVSNRAKKQPSIAMAADMEVLLGIPIAAWAVDGVVDGAVDGAVVDDEAA